MMMLKRGAEIITFNVCEKGTDFFISEKLLTLAKQNFPKVLFTFDLINPLQPSVAFLYPLKTSENLRVFWCFQGVQKSNTGL